MANKTKQAEVIHQRATGKHRLVIGDNEGTWVSEREVASVVVDGTEYQAVPDSDGAEFTVYQVSRVESDEGSEIELVRIAA